MKVVIIEDEPRAARRLEKLVKTCLPECKVEAWIETVADGVDYFSSNPQVELIFSDIQLADDLSFEIFKQVDVQVPIIFTTAFNEYAIEAFKTSGIDYLLKPIKLDDLQRAIEKYERLSVQKQPTVDLSQIANLLQAQVHATQEYKQRFLVKVGTQLKTIHVNDIQAIYSKDKANYIYTTGQRSYLLEDSLDHVESVLDPQLFFRLNRGTLLNVNAETKISSYSNSRLRIEIPGLDEMIIVAREKTKGFKKWLEG